MSPSGSANSEQNLLIPSDVANHPIMAKRLRKILSGKKELSAEAV